MNISAATLIGECDRALTSWPFLWDIEAAHHLPRGLLLAVGSRETNLTNEVGDGGHGRGMFQLDDRSHTIPAGFSTDVKAQANVAAGMLQGNLTFFRGDLHCAVAAYNCGAGNVQSGLHHHGDPDYFTAGPHYPTPPGDYGADVLARLAVIAAHYPATSPPPPIAVEDDDMATIVRPESDPTGAKHPTLLHDGDVTYALTPVSLKSWRDAGAKTVLVPDAAYAKKYLKAAQ